jgi:transglutaminase-like putative cysteine protease
MNTISLKWFRYLLFLIALLLVSGCAGLYFHDAGEPPVRSATHSLHQSPHQEYWTGIVFNGAKIGFSHLALSPCENGSGSFDIHSEAVLRFRFLMLDKKIVLRAYDQVADDLSLIEFDYDYNLDGNRMKVAGRFEDGGLEVEIVSRNQTENQTLPVQGKLYPTSIINLYPALHGLELGRHYDYQVYDGETQSIATITQEIVAYEESDLFSGKGYKIETRFHGQDVTTWIDEEGKPLLEMAQGGVIISALETEFEAKRYLAQASINKEDTLLEYSLVKIDTPIYEPEQLLALELALYGIDPDLPLHTDVRQQCHRQAGKTICRISKQQTGASSETVDAVHFNPQHYLLSTRTVPCKHHSIIEKANEITSGAETELESIHLLVEWMQDNIQRQPVDVFTALDVLDGGKAECQGHAYLYAAFARALEIPTRVANGIVYSEHCQGFLYHSWAESMVDETWTAVDPTFGQIPADVTHVKLIEGENPLDLLPLTRLIGRLQVEVISIDGSTGLHTGH